MPLPYFEFLDAPLVQCTKWYRLLEY